MSFDCGTVDPWTDALPHRKNWAPLRQLAAKRACIYFDHKWAGTDDKGREVNLYKIRFSRFCYSDYMRGKSMTIRETPDTIGFRTREKRGNESGFWHYIISFRRGRLALYERIPLGANHALLRHRLPDVDWAPIIANGKKEYEGVMARYERRLIKLVRSKARANGVKLAKGEFKTLNQLLEYSMYPAMRDLDTHFRAQLKPDDGQIYYDNGFRLGRDSQVIISRLRCSVQDVVKSVTGHKGKAMSRLFWSLVNKDGMNRWKTACSWAALLRTWFPVDYTQKLFQAPVILPFTSMHRKEVKIVIQHFSQKKALNILLPTTTEKESWAILSQLSTTLTDTVRSLHALRQADPRYQITGKYDNLTDLHDHLAREARRIKEQDFELKHEWAKDFDGKVILQPDGTTYTVTVPKTSFQLKDWGDQMDNCIGGYGERVNRGYTWLLGLIRDGVCHFGIEITPRDRTIRQFLGKYNQVTPSRELRFATEQLLVEHKIIPQICASPLPAGPAEETEPALIA